MDSWSKIIITYFLNCHIKQWIHVLALINFQMHAPSKSFLRIEWWVYEAYGTTNWIQPLFSIKDGNILSVANEMHGASTSSYGPNDEFTKRTCTVHTDRKLHLTDRYSESILNNTPHLSPHSLPLIFIHWATFLGIKKNVRKQKEHPFLWSSTTHLLKRHTQYTWFEKTHPVHVVWSLFQT